jgi:hypothetical protein
LNFSYSGCLNDHYIRESVELIMKKSALVVKILLGIVLPLLLQVEPLVMMLLTWVMVVALPPAICLIFTLEVQSILKMIPLIVISLPRLELVVVMDPLMVVLHL